MPKKNITSIEQSNNNQLDNTDKLTIYLQDDELEQFGLEQWHTQNYQLK